mgnify:CR=1 FL=1
MPDRRKLHEGLRWPRTQSTDREEAWQRLQPVLATMGLMLHLRHHTQSFTHSISPFSHLYTQLRTTYPKILHNSVHTRLSLQLLFTICSLLSLFFSILNIVLYPIAIRILRISWETCIIRVCKVNINTNTFFLSY